MSVSPLTNITKVQHHFVFFIINYYQFQVVLYPELFVEQIFFLLLGSMLSWTANLLQLQRGWGDEGRAVSISMRRWCSLRVRRFMHLLEWTQQTGSQIRLILRAVNRSNTYKPADHFTTSSPPLFTCWFSPTMHCEEKINCGRKWIQERKGKVCSFKSVFFFVVIVVN